MGTSFAYSDLMVEHKLTLISISLMAIRRFLTRMITDVIV